MRRVIRLSLAWPLLIAGLLLWPMPLPLGLPLTIIALAMLVHDSKTVRGGLMKARRRYQGVDRRLRTTSRITWLPRFARRMLRLTDPRRLRQPAASD